MRKCFIVIGKCMFNPDEMGIVYEEYETKYNSTNEKVTTTWTKLTLTDRKDWAYKWAMPIEEWLGLLKEQLSALGICKEIKVDPKPEPKSECFILNPGYGDD